MDEAERIRAFSRDLADRLADRRVASTVGEGLFVDALPDVYDLNYLRADRGGAGEIQSEVERLLEPFHHRKAVAYHDVDLGWTQNVHLVMAHVRGPDRRVDTSHVREVDFEQVAPVRPYEYADPGLGERLNEAQRRVARAIDARWYAAFEGDTLAAWCHVRVGDGVSQIEDVNTLPELRGLGHGRAVVQHALDQATGLVFLEALEDDWPRELYGRLGFEAIDRKTHHLLPAHPLTSLCLRTPRLELRLATVEELRRLYRVAEDGVHDPEVMPFEVPWTDDLNEAQFLEYHRSELARSMPRDLHLQLIVFLDGEPVGSQGINSRGPGRFVTGSWLGSAYQRHGYGTEMRSAVLTLAFDVLGAEVVQSGAWVENPGSLGVSRKLGYEATGSHSVTPRGVPIEHLDVELTRERFRPLTEVAITGVDPSWFGAT